MGGALARVGGWAWAVHLHLPTWAAERGRCTCHRLWRGAGSVADAIVSVLWLPYRPCAAGLDDRLLHRLQDYRLLPRGDIRLPHVTAASTRWVPQAEWEARHPEIRGRELEAHLLSIVPFEVAYQVRTRQAWG